MIAVPESVVNRLACTQIWIAIEVQWSWRALERREPVQRPAGGRNSLKTNDDRRGWHHELRR